MCPSELAWKSQKQKIAVTRRVWLLQPTETSTYNTLNNIAQKYISKVFQPPYTHKIPIPTCSKPTNPKPTNHKNHPPKRPPIQPAHPTQQTKPTCWKDQGRRWLKTLNTVKRSGVQLQLNIANFSKVTFKMFFKRRHAI